MAIRHQVEEKDFLSGRTVCAGSGRAWTQRLVDSYGLVLMLAGSCHISFRQSVFPAGSGALILLRPGIRHRFEAGPDAEMLWFHFLPRPHLTPLLQWPEAIPGLAVVTLDGDEFKSVSRELGEAQQVETQHLAGWYALACALLDTAVIRGFNRLQTGASDSGWIQTAQKMLLNRQVSIDDIVVKCGLSRAGFYSKFKQVTGMSPRQYRETACLRHAARLLEASMLTVGQIAEQAGMPDAFYFSTRFRRCYGMSPRQYRHRMTAIS